MPVKATNFWSRALENHDGGSGRRSCWQAAEKRGVATVLGVFYLTLMCGCHRAETIPELLWIGSMDTKTDTKRIKKDMVG